MIVLDVNVLAYLQSFGLLAKLRDVFRLVGGGHVSWQVYMQVKRSGSLGDRLEEWIAEELAKLHNFKTTDPEGRMVGKILKSKHAGLVRKDVADVQCVALARALRETGPATVFTCEGGLQKLCARYHIASVDLFDVLSLLVCEGIVDATEIDRKLQPWKKTGAGNGKPPDFAESFESTFHARYSSEGCERIARLFSLQETAGRYPGNPSWA